MATIQTLNAAAPEDWALTLRIENFSTVPMRFDHVSVAIEIGGARAGIVEQVIALDVPGQSAEILAARVSPEAAAREALAALARSGSRVSYTLRGEIVSGEPRGRFPFEATSWLTPVPGRPDEYR